MAYHNNLRIYHLARHVLRDIVDITESNKGFGDLHSQIRRAAISVVSNICEGAFTFKGAHATVTVETSSIISPPPLRPLENPWARATTSNSHDPCV